MKYLEARFSFAKTPDFVKDLLVACLAELGFESFVENDDATIVAYIQSQLFDELKLKDFISDFDFKDKIAKGFTALAENDGPYLVHCTEGKDRTGFVCMLLEALCGATYEELVDDYMITYANYYRITKSSDPEKYDVIVSNLLVPMIEAIAGDGVDITKADLASCAEAFLINAGMSADQIGALRAKLQK